MTPLVLLVTALLVRVSVGALFHGPGYPDSYYYVNVAQQLAAGNGLSVDYIWSFIDVGSQIPANPVLPIPAGALWMPLAAIIQVPFVSALGPNWIAAGLPFWIIGAAAAPLTYYIGRDAGISKITSTGAGLLVAVPGGLTPFLSQPDNFGPYMTLSALALWLCARGLAGDRRAFVVGGFIVGLATLSRSDGILLGVPFAIVGLAGLRRSDQRWAWITASVLFTTAFAAIFGPWLIRQLEVFGSLSPAASNGRVLWLTDHDQIFSIGPPLGPSDLLAQGLGPLVVSRLGGLLASIGLFVYLPLVVVLTPFLVVGLWAKRRHDAFQPFFVYAAVLFAASSLLFAVMVPHGFFVHSGSALVPHSFLLVAVGVAIVVEWVGRRRRAWSSPQATTVMTYGAVAIALLGAMLQTAMTTNAWAERRAVQQQLASALATAPAADRLMSADPGAYRYLAGRVGIATPNNELHVIEAALRAYDIRWLALEGSSIVPALIPVLNGSHRPEWLSAPIASIAGASSASGNSAPAALYAVCFAPTDNRCLP